MAGRDVPRAGGPGAEEANPQRGASEGELRRHERAIAAITEATSDIIVCYDRALRINFVNAAAEHAVGIPRARLLGRTLEEAGFPADLVQRWRRDLERVLRGESTEMEFAWEGPLGRRWMHARTSPEQDDSGAVVGVVTSTRDVTERREAESARLASEQRFRALIENSSDLTAVIDGSGRILYASPSYRTVLGHDPGALVGADGFRFVHPDDVPVAAQVLGAALANPGGPIPPVNVRFLAADGTARTFSVTLSDQRGDPAVGGFVANSRDVTEQLRLEERLRQGQKLEALGQLAGGVAHDFNNILASVLIYAQELSEALPPGDPRREDADQIVRAATRGAAVAKQLLAFGRKQPLDLEVLDLVAVVHDTARMLRPLLPSSIALELPPEDAPVVPVRAARAQIAQIVMNLALNGRDAMPRGGTLRIRVGTRAASPGAGEAVLTLADTGHGIPREIRERVFDPFFTTKPVGEGTGLGLATVYGLVRQFGGTIALESSEGAGTTFVVSLPLAAEVPDAAAQARRAAAGVPDRRRVLVVEDEAPIRSVAQRILARGGYEVAIEADGRAALDRLRRGEPCDVLVTDAAMPHLSGWELARQTAALRPTLPIVLMSGYATPGGREGESGDTAVRAFLQKPFTSDELLEAVRRALARETASE